MKASTAVRREPAPVPDDLRLRRAELGFDFGKFDFVIHEGRAVLLDANRTPSRPPNLSSSQQREISSLADGFERLISGRTGEAPSRTPGRLGRWIFPELHWRRFRAR